MVLALAFIASAPYFARCRRHVVALVVGMLLLGVGGYALYDHYYVLLNLRLLGDITALRADCERLMRNAASVPTIWAGDEMPESMQRLKIESVEVAPESVALFCSGSPAIFYEPRYVEQRGHCGWLMFRRTWFSGFYKY